MVRRLFHLSVGLLRHILHRQQLVVAHSVYSPGPTVSHSAHLRLVRTRVTKVRIKPYPDLRLSLTLLTLFLRFLIAKGRTEEAHQIIAKVHANGDINDEVVTLEMQEIKDTIKLEQEFEGNGWLQLIKTKGNRRRLIILLSLGLFSQWSGNGLASYYMNIVLKDVGITATSTQLVINGCLQILNIIVAVGQCFVVDYFGRRTLFLTATTGMFFTFIVWTTAAGEYVENGVKGAGNLVVACVYIYYVFYNMAWSGLLVGYAAEILPYSLRAKGLTVMFLMVDLALFFNQYVNPIALEKIAWK